MKLGGDGELVSSPPSFLFALSSGSGGTNVCLAAMCMSTFLSSSFTTTSVFGSAGTRKSGKLDRGPRLASPRPKEVKKVGKIRKFRKSRKSESQRNESEVNYGGGPSWSFGWRCFPLSPLWRCCFPVFILRGAALFPFR